MNIQKNFITFEGCEGVGKSTQINLLRQYLQQTNQAAVFTREPGGTAVAEKIRQLILTDSMSAECEALLFAAARCEHINEIILPSLQQGNLVVCDRYLHSSLAYQGYARGLGIDYVNTINSYAQHCLPQAIVFLDMDPLQSWRKQKGNTIENDRMESEQDGFHQKVYQGFRLLALENKQFISIVPDQDKMITSQKIITALRQKGIIL